MQVQLEILSALERRLSVAMPIEIIDEQVLKRLKQVARTAKVQGFRPGKAPLKMVDMHYGAQVRQDVMKQQIYESIFTVVNQEQLNVVNFPYRHEILVDAEQFKFRTTLVVYPQINVDDLQHKIIEKPVFEVTGTEIDKTIAVLRKQHARFERIEREAMETDRITIDLNGTIDGETWPGGSKENMSFILGAGKALADIEASVKGMKAGETTQVAVDFPEDFHTQEVAGKKVVFKITLTNIEQMILPEIDETFAKSLGIKDGNLETLRTKIDESIWLEIKYRLEAHIKENIIHALLDIAELKLPETLTTQKAQRLIKRGYNNNTIFGNYLAQQVGMLLPDAGYIVTLGLMACELIKENQLQSTPEQTRALIKEFSKSFYEGLEEKEIVAWHANAWRLDDPTNMATENNLIQFVLSKAQVIEKTVSYEDLIKNESLEYRSS